MTHRYANLIETFSSLLPFANIQRSLVQFKLIWILQTYLDPVSHPPTHKKCQRKLSAILLLVTAKAHYVFVSHFA